MDYAATTPVDKRVLKDMLPYYLEEFGNPSSTHSYGQKVYKEIIKTKEVLKEYLKADDYEIVFTSCATESINTCLKSLFFQYGHEKNIIITSKAEHKAVLEVCSYLESIGAEIVYLPIDKEGNISICDLKKLLNNKILAVALMAVNNETGVIYDIETIGSLCKLHEVKFVCDTTQAIGKININLHKAEIDYLVLSAHKLYGPKGVGALLFKKGNSLMPLIHGGGQQNNYRSGTFNASGIIGLGSAILLLNDIESSEKERISAIQKRFEKELLQTGKLEIISEKSKRSPYISNVHFVGMDIDIIKANLQKIVAFSGGSTCTSKIVNAPNVITSMGYSNEEAGRCLRFSFGRMTTDEEVDAVIKEIKKLL